jgi:hypothetical protein
MIFLSCPALLPVQTLCTRHVDGHFLIAIVTADPLHNKEATVRVILEKGGDYLVGTKANTSKRLEGAAEPLRGSLFELSCEGQRGRAPTPAKPPSSPSRR